MKLIFETSHERIEFRKQMLAIERRYIDDQQLMSFLDWLDDAQRPTLAELDRK